MLELQQAAVAAHISDLAREAAALRAERARDELRGHATEADEAFNQRSSAPPRRVRLGRWLVGVGRAIAGPADPAEPARLRSAARCEDSSTGLPRAA